MAKTAARLYKQFQPENYHLSLKPDRQKMTFSGKVVITGRKTGRPAKRLTLHQSGLKVSSAKIVKLDKKAAVEIAVVRTNSHKSYDELRLHTAEMLFPGNYKLEIEFKGIINDRMHGLYPCYYDDRRKNLLATQLESHHARELFPCVDEPEAKATFDLCLTAPAGEVVLSNTPAKSTQKKGRWQEVIFETSPRMSSYLLAFVIGDLRWRSGKTAAGLEVRAYSTPHHEDLLSFAVKTAIGCVEFFEDYFGVKYPLPKLDLAALPDFSAGAMENWGLITFRESLLLDDPKTTSIETRQYVALVIAHEVAHMWFGNLVTMKWWDDLWLNESFANMMEYRAVDELFPEWRIWEQFVNREVGGAMSRDSLPNVQTVSTTVHHPDELSSLFDPAIVYAKGGSLLNMLRHMMGEAAFRRGLKIYFDRHAYQNTQADDLWQALSEAAGQNIGAFMNNWLNRPGFPVVEIDHVPGSGNYEASQKRLVAGGLPAKPTLWQIPLEPSDGSQAELQERTASIDVKTPDGPLIVNHLGHSYFAVNYANRAHWQSILDGLRSGSLETIDRLQLIQHNLLLEKALIVSTADNLELLAAYRGEEEESVWGEMAGVIGNARKLIVGNQAEEKKLDAFVRWLTEPTVMKLGWKGQKSDSPQRLRLRDLVLTLASAAQSPHVIEEGLRHFKDFKRPSDLAPDIRGAVYYIGARFGSDSDFSKLVKAHDSAGRADERDELAGSLAATRQPKRFNQLLAMMTTPAKVRVQDVPYWFSSLLFNYYSRQATWKWLIDNWEWVIKHYGQDKNYERFARVAGMVFSTEEELDQFEKFFGPKKKIIALKLAVSLGIEDISTRIAWRNHNEKAVKQWLAKWQPKN